MIGLIIFPHKFKINDANDKAVKNNTDNKITFLKKGIYNKY